MRVPADVGVGCGVAVGVPVVDGVVNPVAVRAGVDVQRRPVARQYEVALHAPDVALVGGSSRDEPEQPLERERPAPRVARRAVPVPLLQPERVALVVVLPLLVLPRQPALRPELRLASASGRLFSSYLLSWV